MASVRGPSLGQKVCRGPSSELWAGSRRGWEEPRGPGSPRSSVRSDARAPRPQAPGCSRGRPAVPGGAASRAVKGVQDFGPHDDPALGLQRLSLSEDRQAARSRRRFAAWAEVSGRREEVRSASGLRLPLSALRVPHSPQLLQPEPGSAHRARPQPAP